MAEFIQLVIIGSIGIFLARSVYLWWQFRSNVSRIFSKPQFEEPDRAIVEDLLKAINQESSTFLFTMNRLANISFSGQVISVVDGTVGCISPFESDLGSWWTTKRTVFTIARSAQSEWMQDNPKVFKPIFRGTASSIFWVKLTAL